MKVLLISANTEQINMPVLPLGMAYIAAAVQNAGHEVKTVNLMIALTSCPGLSVVAWLGSAFGLAHTSTTDRQAHS